MTINMNYRVQLIGHLREQELRKQNESIRSGEQDYYNIWGGRQNKDIRAVSLTLAIWLAIWFIGGTLNGDPHGTFSLQCCQVGY